MEDEVQERLKEHIKLMHDIGAMRRCDVSCEDAEARLRAFWAQSCKLARFASELNDPESDNFLSTLTRISRETLANKKLEFGFGELPLEDERDDLYEGNPEDWGGGDGGAAIPATINPKPPPRSGADAKPMPPVDEMRDP